MDALLGDSHLAAPHELAELLAGHAVTLGVTDAVAYVIDLQQSVLVPFLGSGGARLDQLVDVLGVDSTSPDGLSST